MGTYLFSNRGAKFVAVTSFLPNFIYKQNFFKDFLKNLVNKQINQLNLEPAFVALPEFSNLHELSHHEAQTSPAAL